MRLKYFDENMNTMESRARYFDLMIFHPVPEEEKDAVRKEREIINRINIRQEREMLEAGYIGE